jgi:hypothetical protein
MQPSSRDPSRLGLGGGFGKAGLHCVVSSSFGLFSIINVGQQIV